MEGVVSIAEQLHARYAQCKEDAIVRRLTLLIGHAPTIEDAKGCTWACHRDGREELVYDNRVILRREALPPPSWGYRFVFVDEPSSLQIAKI